MDTRKTGVLATYQYFVDKGISPLGEETSAFFSRLTSPVVICLQWRAISDISPVHKLPLQRLTEGLSYNPSESIS
jgi:hypothetical protein